MNECDEVSSRALAMSDLRVSRRKIDLYESEERECE